MSSTAEQKLAMLREKWGERAESFTESANKKMTIQGARVLHSHLQLESAKSVLEIAAGGGLGSIDVLQRMSQSGEQSEPKRLVVTDLAPQMVQVAKRNVTNGQQSMANSQRVKVDFMEANGEDLSCIETGSMDRYIASLCLMMTPNADAMLKEARRVLNNEHGIAGFSIWGQEEHTAQFAIEWEVMAELGMEMGGEKNNYNLGKDLPALRQRFVNAGFSQVRIWPFLLVSELWDSTAFAEFCEAVHPTPDAALREKRKALLEQKANHWLQTKGFPIGLEVYFIVAKV